jgi:hypothetical protein
MGAVDTLDDALRCEISGYRVVARRTASWDAIVAVLLALDAEHSAYFHRMMGGCRSLSNSAPEIDGLDDLFTVGDQVMFDLAVARERRREAQGYAAPAEARAFLQTSRQLRLAGDTAPAYDPVARAYFRAIATTADADDHAGDVAVASESTPPETPEDAVAAIDAVLFEAGVVSQPQRALLGGGPGDVPRFARMQAQLQLVRERDYTAFSIRSQELAYLANALAVGCSIQARPLTLQEASDAAVAVCNLGLENWPALWLPEKAHRGSGVQHSTTALPDDFLLAQDLVSVFQVGWTVLHEQVCMYSAEALIDVLAHLQRGNDEIQSGLDELRVAMKRHWRAGEPWRARDALDVIVILDAPAWAALLGLIDQCPVMHAGLGASQSSGTHAVSATAFDFISENSQIASVHAFMRSLPDMLRR